MDFGDILLSIHSLFLVTDNGYQWKECRMKYTTTVVVEYLDEQGKIQILSLDSKENATRETNLLSNNSPLNQLSIMYC